MVIKKARVCDKLTWRSVCSVHDINEFQQGQKRLHSSFFFCLENHAVRGNISVPVLHGCYVNTQAFPVYRIKLCGVTLKYHFPLNWFCLLKCSPLDLVLYYQLLIVNVLTNAMCTFTLTLFEICK